MPMNPRTLRPSSTFTPKSISGLALWLDASDGSTLFQNSDGTTPATATSDPVGYWRDKSGNNKHAVQPLAGSRPTISATTQNGRNQVALTSTSGNALRISSFGLSAPFSLLAVVRKDARAIATFASSTDQTRIQFGDGSATFSGAFYGASRVAGAVYGSAPIAIGRHQVFVAVADSGTLPSSLSMFSDGIGGQAAVITAGTAPSNSIGNSLAVGGDGTGSWGGTVCEMIAYSKSLTLTERRRVESYLARRWGITLAPQVANADAQDWVNRVYTNGETVSTSTANAVNSFCDDIDAAGIRDRFYRLNLFCGTGLNAALVPLYRSTSFGGSALGNATDTNVGPFVSGDYAETGATGGLKGNGSSKYLDTGLQQATIPSLNDSHLSASFRELDSSGERTIVGAWAGTQSQFAVLRREPGGNRSIYLGSFDAAEGTGATDEVHVLGSRSASNVLTLYRAGGSLGTLASPVAPTTTTQPFYVFARNNADSAASTFTALRLRMYSIGTAIDDAAAQAFSDAVSAFNTALNRA